MGTLAMLARRIPVLKMFFGDHVGDHRRYVGGLWDEMGRLQFDFLVSRGLKPEHHLLDIACGSLRAGRLFIPYLQAGHYLGIDKEEGLIQAGVANEVGEPLVAEKRPQFVVSRSFEFERFGVRPEFALAQSLFTHLTPEPIDLCFAKLRPVIADEGAFYSTWFIGEQPADNPAKDNDHARFYYTPAEIEGFGARHGFGMELIGDWNHPRGQQMVVFRPV